MRTTILLLALCLCLCSVAQAKIVTLQVTLGAGATQVSTATFIGARWIVFQDNSGHGMRLGDGNVSATRGVALATGQSFYQGVYLSPTAVNLASWYVYGTAGDVLDVVYDDGN